MVLESLDKLPESVAEHRTAIRIQPDFAVAHNKLEWSLVIAPGRPPRAYDEALTHARKAAELAKPGENHHGTVGAGRVSSGALDRVAGRQRAGDGGAS
jgi:hypothetical protein